ncbi:MAG: hypothetical protein NXI04_24525 [Planctomycetaceae bacterium]|nr:hypothetical protein [Planctomycetaceae bacterium]
MAFSQAALFCALQIRVTLQPLERWTNASLMRRVCFFDAAGMSLLRRR